MAGKRKLTTREQLRRNARCTKRYGRATVTFRRWGGLTDDSELARVVRRCRKGEAAADEVVDALIATRLVAHSPTFDRARADRTRLLALAAECSKTPPIADTTPQAVANALARAQEDEEEQIRASLLKFRESLNRSFQPLNNIGFSVTQRWAEQQSSLLESLRQRFQPPRMAPVGVPRFAPTVPRIGLAAAAALPNFASSFAVRLPPEPYREVTRSLLASLRELHQPVTPAFRTLVNAQAVTVRDVVRAASAAARVAAVDDDQSDAAGMTTVADELAQLAEQPTIAKVEQLVERVTGELRAVEDRQIAREKATEERQTEREEAAEARAVDRDRRQREEARGYFVVAIYVAILLFLLTLLLTPMPAPVSAPPTQTSGGSA